MHVAAYRRIIRTGIDGGIAAICPLSCYDEVAAEPKWLLQRMRGGAYVGCRRQQQQQQQQQWW